MRYCLLLLALLTSMPAALPAQWHLTLRTGAATSRGHALAETDPDKAALRPSPTRDIAAAFGLDRAGWRVAAGVRRTAADLVIVGKIAGVITTDALRATAVSAEIGRRVIGTSGRPMVHLLAGVSRERWSFADLESEARSRTLVGLALEGDVPLSGRWRGIVRVEGSTGSSIFTEEELPGGFTLKSGRRGAMHLGIRWGR